MTTFEVAKYIYTSLTAAGVTKEGACAVLGNIQAESGFIVNNLEDSKNRLLGLSDTQYTEQVDNGTYINFIYDASGYGLPQWTYWSRKQGFLNYAKSKNKSIGDLQIQVEYLIKEFQEVFPGIWNSLKSDTNLYNLTWLLLDKWENPAVKNISTRYQYAQTWYNQINSLAATPNANPINNTSNPVETLLNVARKELGYREGYNNYIKYAEDSWDNKFYGWDLQHQPWCDVFSDYCFITAFGMQTGAAMTYQTVGRGSALCSASASYYRNNNAFYNYPQPGDQAFFYYDGDINHTGIVESVVGEGENWTSFTTIEGNSGDQVARRTYNRGNNSIAGFGRPKWSLVTNNTVTAPLQESGPLPAYPSGNMRLGSTGERVRTLQLNLIKLGYSCGPDGADGDFGKNTLAAVLKFQGEHGLKTDGEVGTLTLAAIEKAIKQLEELKIGDIVYFSGNTHYVSAIAASGYPCTPGVAKVTMISKNSNTKHPYHIVHTDNKSNVYGWVDQEYIEKIVPKG